MFKRLIPLAVGVALMGCQNLTAADVASRVIKGGAVAVQGFFISEADEIKIGQQTMGKVFAEMPEYPNPGVRDYVTQVGQKMVAQCERPTLAFQFHVIQSNEVNAFAAPGGFVFVTTGALRLMKNEAQLAGVVGHEVGHVAKRHSVEAIKKAMIAQGVATAVLDGSDNKLVQTAANVASNLILKGFDRGAELEADTMGAQYAYKAGYDPRELGTFLDALRQTSGDIPPYLVATSDHPRTDDRLTKLDTYISAQNMQLDSLKTDAADFKSHVLDVIGSSDPAPAPKPSASTSPTPSDGPTPYSDPANLVSDSK